MRIGLNNHLIALLHRSHFLVGTEDEGQGIKPIATSHAMARANILGVVGLKQARSLTFEKPTTRHDIRHRTLHLLEMRSVDLLKGKIGYVHSFLCYD